MIHQSDILSIAGITKSFGHIQALRGVSLEVKPGAITAIVGDNGSGKSTLIKILSGNIRPDSGSIRIGGADYRSLSIRKAMDLGIRTVYQDLALDNFKNSVENIFLGSELMRGPFLDKKAMMAEARRLLQDIHVEIPDLTEPVRSLSGGQRQGVAIARALRRTMNMLSGLRSRGMTQLIISHNLHQVFAMADYIYVMRSGTIIAGVATRDTSVDALQDLILQRESEAESP